MKAVPAFARNGLFHSSAGMQEPGIQAPPGKRLFRAIPEGDSHSVALHAGRPSSRTAAAWPLPGFPMPEPAGTEPLFHGAHAKKFEKNVPGMRD